MTDGNLSKGGQPAARPDAAVLARYIDHTLLKPEAGRKDIERLCEEALRHRFYSVCVNSVWVPVCREALAGSEVRISTVCGFPLGAAASKAKAFEAQQAAEEGAEEIDMVLQVGRLRDGDRDAVRRDIGEVVAAVRGRAIVKVIIETALLTDEQKVLACRLAEEAGAHFVKTSTGFGPGGATENDVRLMRGSVSPHIGVKASGGIRDLDAALRMIAAGATRLGTSAGVAIMNGLANGLAAEGGFARGDSSPRETDGTGSAY